MAKSDIPFDLFFEKYYPEGRLIEHIDLSKTSNAQEYAKAMNDYFDMMERVTLEDLQSLTEEELNCVPTSWLYDWHHCKTHYFADGEPEKFIDGVYKKREEYRKIDEYIERKSYQFCKLHRVFTAKEMQEELGITYEEFLALEYCLILKGRLRYQDGQYFVIKEEQ